MRIGIFGGSFNPVHAGHLKLASHAASELNLQRVIFVPSRVNPLKNEQELLPAAFRVRLLRLALRGHRVFSVSLCELARGGRSYTVDTLEYFRKKFKGATLYFLCGADTMKGLSRWKKPGRVLELCRFTVFSRPGHGRLRKDKRILRVPLDALPVSSSEVRRRLNEGLSVRGLVPKEILKPIENYYRENHTV